MFFTDNNDKTILTIAVDGNEKMETYYVYDARNQLRYVLPPEATHQLGMSIDISVLEKRAYYYDYDALGQLKRKLCGEHIVENLSYNICGWITDIQSSYFSQTLHYTDGSGIPCYNGNISSMTWHSGSEDVLQGYKFVYDGFSRLKDVVYGEGEL